jgi:phosphatidylinositol kinase/protein kinase (PI-3  family)
MSYQSKYPAFMYNSDAANEFKDRLLLNISDDNISLEIDKLVAKSYNHFGTYLYDEFQLSTNGIVP